MLVILLLITLLAPHLTAYAPREQNLRNRLSPPTAEHPLGTDMYGRDLLSRLLYGGRISLAVGLLSMIIAVVVGTLVGALSGYYGGWMDHVLVRFTEVVMAFPLILLALTALALVGSSVIYLILIIGLTAWPVTARLVRGEFLRLRNQDFVQAARAVGGGDGQIIFRHLLPNALGPMVVTATLGVAGAVLLEAALSYLGIGVQPPTPSWGNILYEGQRYLRAGAWWYTVFPGMTIFLTVLSINLVGDALRDSFDPRQRL